jgi:anaerobic selenocysteine-containing dehydrogenase
VAKPPADADVVDDVHIFWALAKRMGHTLTFMGMPFDMNKVPSVDDVLTIVAERAKAPWDEIRAAPLGGFYEGEPQYAEPADPGSNTRFTICPPDVEAELKELAAENFLQDTIVSNGVTATHRMTVRRQRHMWNSVHRELPRTRKRAPYNTAMMNPEDIAALGIAPGDPVRVSSETTTVEMITEADATMRRGAVAIVHGYGNLPDDNDYKRDGVSVNILISTDANLQAINAMPRMTSIPVCITPADRRNSQISN